MFIVYIDTAFHLTVDRISAIELIILVRVGTVIFMIIFFFLLCMSTGSHYATC